MHFISVFDAEIVLHKVYYGLCCNLTFNVAFNVRLTTNGLCAKNNTRICLTRTSNNCELLWRSLLLLAATMWSFAHVPAPPIATVVQIFFYFVLHKSKMCWMLLTKFQLWVCLLFKQQGEVNCRAVEPSKKWRSSGPGVLKWAPSPDFLFELRLCSRQNARFRRSG